MKHLFLPILFCSLFISGCLNMNCEVTPMERASNPSGNLQAVKVLIDCGATTTPSSSIRIVESSDTTDIGKPEGTISGDSTARIEFRWKNDDTLIITGDTTGIYPWENSYQLKKRKGQISIVYEKKVIE